MKSPFPGLDPFVEPFWSGIHTRMMVQLCDQISKQLPKGLWADVEETVVVEGAIDEKSYYRPDSAVFDSQAYSPENTETDSNITVAEPLVVADGTLETTERTLVITDTTSGDGLVTAIELLSPANKLGSENRARYIAKRNAYRAGGANLVEVDLVRSGNYLVGAPQHVIPASRRNDNMLSVYRAYRMKWEIYPISLRESLPSFKVPLRPNDYDVVIQLQLAFDDIFQKGAYSNRINYANNPEPSLNSEDKDWANKLLQSAKLR